MARGERAGAAKLTTSEVQEIRALYATGAHTLLQLALKFRCAETNVHNIVSRKTWVHLP
jgi:hypothetical protein